MKLFSYYFISLLVLVPALLAFQAHNQSLRYTHPAIVVSNGVSYLSLQDVPEGTTITSTAYWTPLLSTAPSAEPGDPPVTEPSSDELVGLPTPDPVVDDPDLPNRGSLEVRLGNISTAAYIPNNQPFSSGFQAQLDSAGLDYKGAIMVGYTVVGNGNKNLLLTGKGHTEGDSTGNLIPAMSDPRMEVWGYPFNPTDKLTDPDGSNDDWQNGFYQSQINTTNFFNQYESKYSGLYPTLTGGSYVSIISSADGGSGNVRGETYETYQMGWTSASDATAKLTGVSTNGWVQAGNEPGQRMTAGVGIRNLSSDTSLQKRLICMGKGLGHPYATPLYNPRIEVTDMNHNVLATNESWTNQSQSMIDAINITGLMNNWGADNACVIVTVTPSQLPYSSVLVKLYSEDGQSGNGLVEVYDLDLLESVYGYDAGQ